MTTKDEAMKLALENAQPSFMAPGWTLVRNEAITALREALAKQPAQQQTYEQANPLGGPAKVFQAMADAIRAGDSYHAVLRQYGYAEAEQQEPVAWGNFKEDGTLVGLSQHPEDQANWTGRKPLYTSPQPAQQQEPVAKPKLIGWRTENFLWETDDIKKAQNWEPNIGVLPIFAGDPNTQLTPPASKPLTGDEIHKMWMQAGEPVPLSDFTGNVRRVEAAHSIKEKNNG